MTNVLSFANDLLSQFVPTLAKLFDEVFAYSLADALEGSGFIPELFLFVLELVGVSPQTSILGFLVGSGLYVVLLYNLVKWVVGIVTGS